jgi:hypothetical protein
VTRLALLQTNNGNRCDAKKKVTIKFLTYLEIATNLDSWQPRSVVKSEAPKTLETCYKLVKARIPIYVLEWEYSQKPLREDDLIEAKAIWINSPIRKQILDSLIEARSQFKPVKVTKIVCLGQGPLYMVNMKERDRPGWNLDHHLIAFDIAKKLEELDGQYPEIVFQDPSYMQQDHDWLSNKVEETRKVHVRFAENPRGIFEVDKNTLVLAHCSPSFPVRQIIVDWTKDFGGPAGFFCRTIPEIPDIEAEITHCREASPDHANRYVASMAKDYNMRSVCEVPAWSSTLYIKQA